MAKSPTLREKVDSLLASSGKIVRDYCESGTSAEVNHRDASPSGASDLSRPFSMDSSPTSSPNSRGRKRSLSLSDASETPKTTKRRSISQTPSSTDNSIAENAASVAPSDPPAKENRDGIPLFERNTVQYTTKTGVVKVRKQKRSHKDEFFWDKTVDPTDATTRKRFQRGYLAEHLYNLVIDTHCPAAVVYIDPVTNIAYYAGAGRCLDFINIPDDQTVRWIPPNHPQSGMMSQEFCRLLLPSTQSEKPPRKRTTQLKTSWKISDLNLQPGPPISENLDMPEEETDMLDEAHPIGEFTPVYRKSRGTPRSGARAGARRGPRGGTVRGTNRGTKTGTRGTRGVIGRGKGGGTKGGRASGTRPRFATPLIRVENEHEPIPVFNLLKPVNEQ